jgi:5-formyltetrahydrofolate cyclo-ligase
MTTTLDDEKRRLRAVAKARRAAAAETGTPAAEAVCGNLMAAVPLPAGAVVSAYWPIGNELDPRPLMLELHEARHGIALPVVIEAGQPLVFRAWSPGDSLEPAALVFRAWSPGDSLEPAAFGTRIPGPDKPALTPAVVLAPLLAFDRQGYRLGYGGGFYDRTLEILRRRGAALAIGLAFAAQEVPAVPRDPNDKRLDWIVTEAEAIRLE